MKKITSYFKNNWKFIIALILILVITTYRLPYSIYAPGGKINLSDRYKNELYETMGSLNITYISSYPGTIPIVLLSYIVPNWDLVKNDDIKYDNETMEDANRRDSILNETANSNSIYVAYKKAGYDINIVNKKLYVTYILENAKTNLKIGDIILEADNKVFEDHLELAEYIKSKNESDKVEFKVLRNNKEINCYGILSKIDDQILIGIAFHIVYEYENNPNIEYESKKNELGPSGGLMMALYVYNSLTEEDITHGKDISGTGTIDIDSKVGEIDGVKYKMIGAAKKKTKIFIVPSDNYDEAVEVNKKYNLNLKLIKAETFDQVLDELKELK